MLKALLVIILLVLAAAGGLGAGYYLWGRQIDWYAVDIAKLGPGAENDLIRYGRDLIVDTPKHIGKNATNPAHALCRQRPRLPELPPRMPGSKPSPRRSSRPSPPSRCSSTIRCSR